MFRLPLTARLRVLKTASVLVMVLAIAPLATAMTQSKSTIDLSIDVNQDGVSDELLAATQEVQAFHKAQLERLQANEIAYEAYSIAGTTANLQLEARLPFSDRAKQILVQQHQIVEELNEKYSLGGGEALEAELGKLSEELNQDPSYLRVIEAQSKVYKQLSL